MQAAKEPSGSEYLNHCGTLEAHPINGAIRFLSAACSEPLTRLQKQQLPTHHRGLPRHRHTWRA